MMNPINPVTGLCVTRCDSCHQPGGATKEAVT
jgi:hypothetical protein